jgi:DNA repair exonuclease SbcCD ATPase subunit
MAAAMNWRSADVRIESVTAQGFGPLSGQTLRFAPGLTVVVGDNESGKSSWHAAIFAALCGRRRGRGRQSVLEQRFIDTYQPWSGDAWAVSGVVLLDDGRRIELRQDLSGKVDCRASDTVLARDVSAEIMVDGSPDASAWLGLTRASFQATACVGQAEMLGVIEAADGLQDALQRAASTAGTSGTAAAAIELLEDARRTAVGRDIASAVRPLRRAREAVAAAELRLEHVVAARDQLTELAAEADRLADEAAAAERVAQGVAEDVEELGQKLQQRPAAPRPAPVLVQARPGRKPWVLGAAAVAVALLVAAVVARSVPLGVGGALVGAAALWVSRGSAMAAPSDRAMQEQRSPADPESVELRMAYAERRALAEGARRRHYDAALRAGRADERRAERGSALPSAAEAQEALAAANRELTRVLELDETLGQAIGFLSRAQERVHRSVAPELTDVLRRWLPRLTDGRYVDARLDPALLEVSVAGVDGEFRRAQLLSHGTAEQIYLLLRVALVRRLTADHDTCPLLLDDVTVHADPVRTAALLELLHELSDERQIVLFAHQDQVREWAYEHLVAERDAVVELGILQRV